MFCADLAFPRVADVNGTCYTRDAVTLSLGDLDAALQ